MEKSKVKVKDNLLLFSIAIILTKFAIMGDFAIYPITNEFYNLFPNMAGIVNYIISGPQLIIMAMAFAVPLLAKKFSKRVLTIWSCIIFGIGTVLTVLIVNPYVMVIGRSLVGIGQGILGIVTVTIIADVITDTAQQPKYVGIYNSSSNIAAMLLSLGAGVLAGYSWKHPFLLYLITIPMIIAVVLFIPDTKNEQTKEVKHGDKTTIKSLGIEFWMITVAASVFSMLRTIITYYMSFYVAENALGGTGITATAASLAQLFAFVGAFSFGVVYSKIERWIMPLACGIITIALILWCVLPTPITVFIVYSLACGSSGMFMAYSFAHIMAIVEKEQVDSAVAIVSAGCGIAAFVPTYLVTCIMKLHNTTMVTPTTWVYATIGAVLFAVTLLFTTTFKGKAKKFI